MAATIQFIEETIAALEQAARANEDTPARVGNEIVLTAELGDEVLISADLHGHRRNYNLILKRADLDRHPRRHLIMQEVCHGGPAYPSNGGCMSHAMLEDVARLKVKYPDRFHFLLSNHEWAELVDYPILKAKKMLNLMFRLGIGEAYGPAAEKVREAYLPFIRSCPLAVRLPGDVVACHSAPENVDTQGWDASLLKRPLDATDLQEHGDLFWLLWGRDYRPENARAFAQAIHAQALIHGHDPCSEGYNIPNDMQIIIDCCGDKACTILLPLDRSFTHGQIVERIERL